MKHGFLGLATLLGGFLGSSQVAHAQGNYADDALLYSRQGPAGTARTLGLAGANVSLGGDFGNLTSNPAGLGFFTKSEISVTPGVGFGNASSTPAANLASVAGQGSLSQTANSFHIASAGIVFASRRPDNDNSSDWRGGSFALGFTRLADFNQAFSYNNTTDDNHSFFQFLREPGGYTDYTSAGYQSAVQGIKQQSSTGDYTNLDGLAYDNFLTNFYRVRRSNLPGDTTTVLRAATPPRTGAIQQHETVMNKGSMSQFDLGYGGNYRDKLYIGIGVGIVSLTRTRTTTFSESSGGVEDFNYQDYLKTTGTGINGRLGLIYRATDFVRLGASVQTPTYIVLQDTYNTTLTSAYVPSNLSNVLSTTPGTYDYSITTPFRANGGVTFLLNKYGFLTGDIEYVGYGQARFNTTGNSQTGDFTNTNQQISNGYRSVVNFRVGAEGRFDIFRARLGYAYYANPYSGTSSFSRDQNYFTGGLGIRTKSFFVDAAGVYLAYKDQYSPYTLASAEVNTNPASTIQRASPVININQNRFTVSLTGGLIF